MHNIIAFCGHKGCGKSEFAKALRDRHDFMMLKMADPIKSATKAILKYMDISDFAIEEYVEGHLKETPISCFDNSLTPRWMMQTIGTDLARKMWYEDFWVDIMKERLHKHMKRDYHVVIDDIRFRNELEMVKEYSGEHKVLTVWLDKENVKVDASHESETSLDETWCDITIRNPGTREALVTMVDHLVKEGKFPDEYFVGGSY